MMLMMLIRLSFYDSWCVLLKLCSRLGTKTRSSKARQAPKNDGRALAASRRPGSSSRCAALARSINKGSLRPFLSQSTRPTAARSALLTLGALRTVSVAAIVQSGAVLLFLPLCFSGHPFDVIAQE